MHTLTTDGGTLAYDLYEPSGSGTGRLVILAPGIGDLRAEYRFLAPLLAHQGLRVAVMDLRGHGDTSAGWTDYTPQAVGRDMLALVEALGGPAILGGCSMAAASAVWAAVERPDQVRGLLLFGPSLEDGPVSTGLKIAMALLFSGPWRVRAWDAFYASLYPGPKPPDLADHRAALRANLAEPGRFAALKAFMDAPKAACAERIERVRVPSLLVMGSRDPDFKDPATQAQAWVGRLGGQAVVIEGSGHYPHVDAPQPVTARIHDWVQASSPVAA